MITENLYGNKIKNWRPEICGVKMRNIRGSEIEEKLNVNKRKVKGNNEDQKMFAVLDQYLEYHVFLMHSSIVSPRR